MSTKVLRGLAGLGILIPTVLYIRHQTLLKREAPLLEKPLGQMIEVDGHKMCVYSEGEGAHTGVLIWQCDHIPDSGFQKPG